jgi:EmrB/QacA subfamily drug resistance transporter
MSSRQREFYYQIFQEKTVTNDGCPPVGYKSYPIKVTTVSFMLNDEDKPRQRFVSRTERLGPIVQFGLIAGPFLSMVDSSVVNIALPVISSDFHTGLAEIQWILSAYLLALAAFLPVSAFLSKRLGARQVYFWSIIGFTFSSFLCALSPNLDFLIFARVLQGALGAPLVPVAMDILFRKGIVPGSSNTNSETQELSPLLGIVLFLAPALGPTLGGFLIGYFGWPSIFLINVPIGIVAGVAVIRYKNILDKRNEASKSVGFDFLGSVLLSLGLVLAIYGASEAPLIGWFSIQTLPYLTGGLLLMIVYACRSVKRVNPAVNIKLVRHSQTALALAISVLASIVLFGVLFLLPVFMESFQGLSSFETGLVLLPQGLVTGVGTVIGTKLPERLGTRLTVAVGMGTLTATTAALLILNITTSPIVTATILSGRGLALGLTIQPLLLATIGSLSTNEISDGNTLFNILERLGGTIGVSLLSTVFTLREEFHIGLVLALLGINPSQVPGGIGQSSSSAFLSSLPTSVRTQLANAAVSGFHDTIILMSIVSLVGLGLAILIRDHRR